MLKLLRKIFIESQYVIWVLSFVLLCCECDTFLIFIISKLIACVLLGISTVIINKYA
jgi:hypothetical protein